MIARALVCLIALFLAPAGASAQADAGAAPPVVVTLKPIHSLVAAVMQGVGAPALLIDGNANPHDYAMRPSDARLLASARLIVMVGPGMENFLDQPLKTLAAKATVVTLARNPNMDLPPVEGGGRDLHLWLDPENAKHIVESVSFALNEVDPAHGYEYARNAARENDRLAELDRDLRRALAPVRGRPFAVYHDAFRGFARRYDLNVIGFLVRGAEKAPGAQSLAALRDKMAATGARCLFTEPQFEPAEAQALARATGARLGELDDLGARLPPGPDMYHALMREIASALLDCLAKG
jgi:zinc transport system substrate-binding protein